MGFLILMAVMGVFKCSHWAGTMLERAMYLGQSCEEVLIFEFPEHRGGGCDVPE